MLDCSVRQKNPILVEAIHFFAQQPFKSFVYPIAILGVDTLPKIFASRQALKLDPIRKFGTFRRSSKAPFGCGHPKPNCPCESASPLRPDTPHFAVASPVPICVGSPHQRVRDLVNDLLIALGRSPRFAIVHCERRDHFALRRDRCGPTGAQRMGQSQVPIRRPQRVARDVLDNDRFAAVSGCPAGAGRWSNRRAVDRIGIGLGKARRGATPQAIAVQQRDGREDATGLPLHKSA